VVLTATIMWMFVDAAVFGPSYWKYNRSGEN